MKKTKLKLFLLAMLGLILIPATNAYELSYSDYYRVMSDYSLSQKKVKFKLYN